MFFKLLIEELLTILNTKQESAFAFALKLFDSMSTSNGKLKEAGKEATM